MHGAEKSEKHLSLSRAIYFLSADYSQIELRLMAHLSKDKSMIGDFLSGNDIHAATASKIFGVGHK